jgi:hypothetical protein
VRENKEEDVNPRRFSIIIFRFWKHSFEVAFFPLISHFSRDDFHDARVQYHRLTIGGNVLNTTELQFKINQLAQEI